MKGLDDGLDLASTAVRAVFVCPLALAGRP